MDSDQTGPDPSAGNPLLMDEIPQTVAQLNAKVQELFHCMVGPPTAYFEIRVPSYDCCGGIAVERFVYTSLVWRTETAREGAEARLVMAMLEPFIDARRQLVGDGDDSRAFKPLLFWRRPLELFAEDHGQGSPGQMKLRCRLVIPGANLAAYEQPEGTLIRSL